MGTFALSIVTGIIIAAASSWITVQLSLSKFRTERWWEKKVTAYEKIIAALHDSKVYLEKNLEAIEERREISEERKIELQKQAQSAYKEISKAIDIGSFVLSDTAHNRLKTYKEQEKEILKSESYYEYLDEDFGATRDCLNDIIRIAKNDLGAK